MGAITTLVLVGFIALVLAAHDLRRALGRTGAPPDTRNENVRKVER